MGAAEGLTSFGFAGFCEALLGFEGSKCPNRRYLPTKTMITTPIYFRKPKQPMPGNHPSA